MGCTCRALDSGSIKGEALKIRECVGRRQHLKINTKWRWFFTLSRVLCPCAQDIWDGVPNCPQPMRSHNRPANQSSRSHTQRPIRRPVSFLASIVAQCFFPTVSESSNLGGTDSLAQDPDMGGLSTGAQEGSGEEQCQRMCTQSLFLTASGPSSNDSDQ